MKKIFYLFAGVNGAGKSTLYNLAMINQNIKNTIRINTDEIVREIGDWKNNSDQLKAAKMAINLRNECFLYGKSFNEETTLTGKTILKTIDKAKELGYELQLFYVGLNSPEEIILKFDKVQLYDNSNKYIEFFSFEDNKILFKTKDISWAKEAIEIIENNIKNK